MADPPGVNFVVAAAAQQPLSHQCLAAAVIGLLAHHLYFIHWTTDEPSLRVAVGHVLVSTVVLLVEGLARGFLGGLAAFLAVLNSYLAALFTSIVIYRAFFHPLRHFPGPFMARITRGWIFYKSLGGKRHEWQEKELRAYGGEFLRTGPNQLLHISIDAMSQVHGPLARCRKGTLYSAKKYGPHQLSHLEAIVDKGEHRYRRQVWDRAFNGKAFEAREQPIRETVLEWLGKVDEHNGRPLDWSLYASLIAFEIMGRTGFSVHFDGLKSGKKNVLQRYVQASFKSIANIGQVPWVVWTLARTGFSLSQDVVEFEKFARELATQRIKDPEPKDDIFQHFLDDYRSDKPKAFFTKDHLEVDSHAILIGAADSTFSPMSLCLREMCLRPDAFDKLRAELAPVFDTKQPGGFAHADLAHLSYLNAVIDETMRLYSPTCQNGGKETPPEGIVLSDRFIPGNVAIVSGIWCFHRSEKYFARPLEWIPERWTSQRELVLDKRAYHPFVVGPFNCVGQRLAMMELRMVIAYTVWFCNIEFAPGEDGKNIVALSRNELFLVPGPLWLKFTKRTV